MDSSPPGSSVPGILQVRILEWVAISFSNACMHAKLLQPRPTLCDATDSSPPGSSVHGILQTELWSGLPFPFPETPKAESKLKTLPKLDRNVGREEAFPASYLAQMTSKKMKKGLHRGEGTRQTRLGWWRGCRATAPFGFSFLNLDQPETTQVQLQQPQAMETNQANQAGSGPELNKVIDIGLLPSAK